MEKRTMVTFAYRRCSPQRRAHEPISVISQQLVGRFPARSPRLSALAGRLHGRRGVHAISICQSG